MPWAAAAAVVGGALIKNADNRQANSMASDAAAQNREANLEANRVNQTNPFGSTTWGTGADGRPTQTTTLDPTQQTLLNNQNTVGTNVGGAAANLSSAMAPIWSKPMSTENLPEWQNVIGQGATNLMTHDWLGNANSGGHAVADAGTRASLSPSAPGPYGGDQQLAFVPSVANNYGGAGGYGGAFTNYQASPPPAPAMPAGTGAAAGGNEFQVRDKFDTSGVTTALPSTIDDTSRQRVEEALMSRLNPQLQQDEQNLRTRLLNSGIEVGTDAYNREFSLQNQKSNDARMQAVLAGGQEEDRQTKLLQGLNDQQFQQALATGKFGQDADMAMAGNATSRSNAATAASATMGAASANNAGALERLKMSLTQQSNEFNVNTGFKAAEFNNNLRTQQLKEQQFLRDNPLSELAAMKNLSSPTMPTFASYYNTNQGPGATTGPDTLGGGKQGLELYSGWNKA